MKKALELYLHIPFCVRKCAYCDFLSFPAEKEIQKQYVNCLIEEIRQFDLAEDYVVSTIFFGGGTPSVLDHAGDPGAFPGYPGRCGNYD